MSIELVNVTKKFGEQKALDSVSFSIDSGQIVGFIGPNGAGKTTTMRIITTFLKPDEGEVRVCGIDALKRPLDVRRKIGYLPEHNPLYYDMYVRDFLVFVAGIYGLRPTKQLIDNIIEITGLGPEQKKKISQLSKGYKQRVGLAQAIIHDPEVLILDEPTSGLDPNQIIEIRNLIKELGKQKTVLLSTHIMQEVEAICDRILIINQGRIVADRAREDISSAVEQDLRTFVVEFDQTVAEQELLEIEGVVRLQRVSGSKWLLQSSDDIRKRIFNYAVSKNYVVLLLEEKQKSLEEIFQELTKGKKNKD